MESVEPGGSSSDSGGGGGGGACHLCRRRRCRRRRDEDCGGGDDEDQGRDDKRIEKCPMNVVGKHHESLGGCFSYEYLLWSGLVNYIGVSKVVGNRISSSTVPPTPSVSVRYFLRDHALAMNRSEQQQQPPRFRFPRVSTATVTNEAR